MTVRRPRLPVLASPGDSSRVRRSVRVSCRVAGAARIGQPHGQADPVTGSGRLPMPVIGGCATLCTMDRADRQRADLDAPGNVFYFVADLATATSWCSARLGVEPVTRARSG